MIAGFIKFLSTFGPNSINELSNLYSPIIEYEDPINKVEGLHHLSLVFEDLFRVFSEINIEVKETLSTDHAAFVRWEMTYQFRKKEYNIDGVSYLEFNISGLICKHKDFWDASFPLYGTFPCLGFLMRAIKKMASVRVPNQPSR